MASFAFNNLKNFLLSPIADITSAGAIIVSLIEEVNVDVTTSASYLSAILGPDSTTEFTEISGTNYTNPGKLLENTTILVNDGTDVAFLDADDLTWTNANGIISAGGCLLSLSAYTSGESVPLAYLDFGVLRISENGPFTLQWLSDGIIQIA